MSAYDRVSKGSDLDHDESYQHQGITGLLSSRSYRIRLHTRSQGIKDVWGFIDFMGADVLKKDAGEQQGVEFRCLFVSRRFVQGFLLQLYLSQGAESQ